MRKIQTFLFILIVSVTAYAQSAQEIVSRMEAEMERHNADGIAMTVEMKIPIVGSFESKVWQLGNKLRMDVIIEEPLKISPWTDGTTTWIYTLVTNEVQISNGAADIDGDSDMFEDVSKGYDVSIISQTSKDWTISCKKSKSNKDKDAPKKMELVIAKGTYYPVSMGFKQSGVTITMRDISFGATEEQVTFNIDDYPGVTVVDKRE